jgi:hypothetical protein
MPDEVCRKLLGRTVRRFSKVATIAVMSLLVTGLYAILLHVPSLSALTGTPYGRAFIVKLGLLVPLLAAGGVNLISRGQGPFDRVVGFELILAVLVFVATGFLTTLPPADVDEPLVEENRTTSIESLRQSSSPDAANPTAQPAEEAAGHVDEVARVQGTSGTRY